MNRILTIIVTVFALPVLLALPLLGAIALVVHGLVFLLWWGNMLYEAISQNKHKEKLPWWKRIIRRFDVPYRALFYLATHDMGSSCYVYDGDGQPITNGKKAMTLLEIRRDSYEYRRGESICYYWQIKTPFGAVPLPLIYALLRKDI